MVSDLEGGTAGVRLTNSACTCPEGQCAAFVEPDTDCINRRKGEVTTARCLKCSPDGGYTWHEDGNCLKCERGRKRAELVGVAPPA